MNKSMVLLFILDLSCFAYDPLFAMQMWPSELPDRFYEAESRADPASNPNLFHRPALQSPIDIRSSLAAVAQLPPLIFKDLFHEKTKLIFRNTGTTVEFELPDEMAYKPKMIGGPLGDVYEFSNLHIHWGAVDCFGGEHEIDGRRFAIEGHCVHYNSKYGDIEEASNHPDGLAVVGFFGEAVDVDNPLLNYLIAKLRHIRYPEASVMVNAREALAWFDQLGEPRNYFTYPGSLTTPPYTENVIWVVYPIPLYLSSRQVEAFRNILNDDYRLVRENIRPIQPFNGRPLIYAA